MSLSAAQLAARAGKLTGSRIACLMGVVGESEAARAERERAIDRLYRELIGEVAEADLSDIWPVRLGAATEALNLEWFERRNGPVSRRGEVVDHPYLPWAACTLDGWCDSLDCPVECKHVGGRERLETVIERYQPQMQWIMEIACADQIALSVIVGADVPLIEFIERDRDYARELVSRGEAFMQRVAARIPPVALPPPPPPVASDRLYDMTGNNQWADSAATWREHAAAAELAGGAAKTLKSLVAADAAKCFGHGVQITRDRAGRLHLRELAS